MKLKNKILILIIGIVIIPVLVTALVGYINMIIFEKNLPLKEPNYFIVRGWLDHTFPEEYKKVYPNLDKIKMPFSNPVVIIDENNIVRFSNIPNIKIGQILKDTDYILRFINKSRKKELIVRPFYIDGKQKGKVIYQLQIKNKRKSYYIIRFFERAAYPIIAIILFSSIMVIIIENSLLRSIRALEEATSRIAQGDLDFKLKPKGNDEIASLTRSFDTMRQKLRENQAQRARFLMAVSHDLKTPLTSIWGYLEAIKDGMVKTPDMLNKYVTIIYKKSKILEDRIMQLLDFARMETGELRLKFKPIDFGNFLTEIADMYREDSSIYKREFFSELTIPENISIRGDYNLLLRAFENLFTNAMRYTEEHDSISFTAKKHDKGILISIKDTGDGIPSKDIRHIFEPFYRGTNSRNEPGTGLGLSIVRSIFAAHGWDINANSEPEKGTEFTIIINLEE